MAQEQRRTTGEALASGGARGAAPEAKEREGQVLEGGERLGSAADTAGGAVLAEDHISDLMHWVCEGPMLLPRPQQIRESGLLGRERGDGISGLVAEHLPCPLREYTASQS